MKHPLRNTAILSALVTALTPIVGAKYPEAGWWLSVVRDALAAVSGVIAGRYYAGKKP